MAIRDGLSQSLNSKAFVLETLRVGKQRIDGRDLNTLRKILFHFTRTEGQATALIHWGRTQVLAVVSSEIVVPFLDRPTEGLLLFNIELTKMAEASVGALRTSPLTAEITRIIERGIKDSQALDTEALCITAGERVWQVRVDVHILDNGGNLIDSCALAAISALQHFRLPEVTVESDGSVIIHHSDVREALPLALHHVPLCFTFALFEDQGKTLMCIDPDETEESIMKGRISLALNMHREICTLHKNGGMAMTAEALMHCAQIAANKVKGLHNKLKEELGKADVLYKTTREKRLRGGEAFKAEMQPNFSNAIPMEIAPDSLLMPHLNYDELHVTGTVREGPVKGLLKGNLSKSEIFSKMIKTAEKIDISHENLESNAVNEMDIERVEIIREEKLTVKLESLDENVTNGQMDEFDKFASNLKKEEVRLDKVLTFRSEEQNISNVISQGGEDDILDLTMAVKSRKKNKSKSKK